MYIYMCNKFKLYTDGMQLAEPNNLLKCQLAVFYSMYVCMNHISYKMENVRNKIKYLVSNNIFQANLAKICMVKIYSVKIRVYFIFIYTCITCTLLNSFCCFKSLVLFCIWNVLYFNGWFTSIFLLMQWSIIVIIMYSNWSCKISSWILFL